MPNRLVIRLQPDESLQPTSMAKVPGDEMRLRPVSLNLDFADTYSGRQWDAYERLLMDDPRQADAVHAARRTRRRVALDRAGPRRLGAGSQLAPLLHLRHLGPAAASGLLGATGNEWRQDS